jgi:hypothetical protein
MFADEFAVHLQDRPPVCGAVRGERPGAIGPSGPRPTVCTTRHARFRTYVILVRPALIFPLNLGR